MKSKVPDGLAYDCGAHGKAYIQFGGGGYLPGGTALAKGNIWNPAQQARPRDRSTAKLTFREGVHDLIAEWSEGGLRYRSEVPFEDGDYLIWTIGHDRKEVIQAWERVSPGRPLTPEDARIGRRSTQDPVDERKAAGTPYTACRRLGRDASADSAGDHGEDHDADHQEPEAEQDEPHAP
jgi:hypothetical protein